MHETKEMWVRFLGGEDPLEEGMETHSSILAWRIPWTEKLGRLQSIGLQRVGHISNCTTWAIPTAYKLSSFHFSPPSI